MALKENLSLLSEARFQTCPSAFRIHKAMGLFAFCSGREVGVDVEEVKEDFKGMQIASHFFRARRLPDWQSYRRNRRIKRFSSVGREKKPT